MRGVLKAPNDFKIARYFSITRCLIFQIFIRYQGEFREQATRSKGDRWIDILASRGRNYMMIMIIISHGARELCRQIKSKGLDNKQKTGQHNSGAFTTSRILVLWREI